MMWKLMIYHWYSTATLMIFIRLRMGEQEVNQHLKLHYSCIDYVRILSELKDLIAEKRVSSNCRVFRWKLANMLQSCVFVW
jgi:hypothetical protein